MNKWKLTKNCVFHNFKKLQLGEKTKKVYISETNQRKKKSSLVIPIEEVRTSPKSENVQNEVVKPKMSYF